jgi:hypothetical protein
LTFRKLDLPLYRQLPLPALALLLLDDYYLHHQNQAYLNLLCHLHCCY